MRKDKSFKEIFKEVKSFKEIDKKRHNKIENKRTKEKQINKTQK